MFDLDQKDNMKGQRSFLQNFHCGIDECHIFMISYQLSDHLMIHYRCDANLVLTFISWFGQRAENLYVCIIPVIHTQFQFNVSL